MNATRPALDRGAVALGVALVVAANGRYLSGLAQIIDPMPSMEPFYIHMAGRPVAAILGSDAAWGPLYALWLKPFVAVLGDPLAVYAANLYALSLATSLLVYLHLVLLTRRAAVAAGAALLFLVSDFNVPLYSKSSAFALAVVLAGLTAAALCRSGVRRTSIAAIGVLLASYARPELYPGALLLCLAAAWCVRGERRGADRRLWPWPAGALAAIVVLAAFPGVPLGNPAQPGGRLLLAFQEHFAWNWSRWHGEWQNVFAVWEREFHGAQTVLAAARSNPAAVGHHLFDNLEGTARFLAGSTFAHYPLLAPVTAPLGANVETLVVSIAVFALLGAVAARRLWRGQFVRRYGDVLVQYAVVGGCCVAAATAIFPVAHYLAIPGVLLLLAGALAGTVVVAAQPPLGWGARLVAAVLCLMAVPTPFVLPSAYAVPGSPFIGRIAVKRPLTDTIQFIRGLGLPGPVQVLALTDGAGELLGPGFNEVKVWRKGAQPLEAYMREHDVGVVINMEGGRDSFRVNDPYWRRFQDDPEAAGFALVPVPGHESIAIYVRRDLLER